MTDLKRLIRRRTCRQPEAIRRRLVVILEPGDTLAMREHGRRWTCRIGLEALYTMLVKRQVTIDRAKKAQERKLRAATRQ